MNAMSPPRRRNDTGASLALVMAYILVVGLVIGALGNWIRNDLNNAVHFANARKTQFALNGAMNVAIENIRYSPLIGAGQTLNASPPSYCFGSSAPSTVASINGDTENVWCSTIWNPASTITRVVTLDACPVALTAAQCSANPSLQAVVNFDDYPQTGYVLVNTVCTTTCGSEMLLDSWIYSGTLDNVLNITVASPPTGVTASFATTSSALVGWTAPTNNGGAPITSYTAVATDTTNGIYSGQSCTSSTTSCTITNLNVGDNYTVVVYATNSAGNSNASSPATPVTANPPTSPTSVSATAGTNQATVTWAAPSSNGGAPITGYTVTSSGGQTCTSTSTSCTVTGLTNGTSYTFTVTATNSAGTSPASSPSNSVTPAVSGLYSFSVGSWIEFTPGGATGMYGPTLAQAQSGLSSNASLSWDTNSTYFSDNGGIQYWEVPMTGTYTFQIAGAAGGNGGVIGGTGAIFTTTSIALTSGQMLEIGAGQIGLTTSDGTGAGGGGASWVYAPSTLLGIAGGGGGGGISGVTNASASSYGNNSNGNPGADSGGNTELNGGTGGQGGQTVGSTCGLGGAGWLGNGPTNSCGRGSGNPAYAIDSTALGGVPDTGTGANGYGGFGGGGAGAGNCGYGGGGGGYSGGGGGEYQSGCGGPGGAGGSYSGYWSVFNGYNSGVGYVTVTRTS